MRWCPDGDFWRLFCVLYLQRAACSTFQTCILNSSVLRASVLKPHFHLSTAMHPALYAAYIRLPRPASSQLDPTGARASVIYSNLVKYTQHRPTYNITLQVLRKTTISVKFLNSHCLIRLFICTNNYKGYHRLHLYMRHSTNLRHKHGWGTGAVPKMLPNWP